MSDVLFTASFFEFMAAQATLTAVVGQKIYPFGETPTGTPLPYVTYQIIDNLHVHNQGGPSGLANPRLQIDSWAETEYDAALLAKIIRLILDGFRGTMGDPGNETIVRVAVNDSDNEQFSPPNDATQKGAYRVQADFLVWFVEEV